ncbi:hypothetical protein AKJ40_02200 [candidate division MSBL1 archaeon SCGC-AAA259M10]|uniref:Cytochrome C biogenesis protein n=2 Tax=candidate division MSBL1 TaxID=215777 RepID=A0A133U3A6_9EURY|nr:hypothetical protein AKJ61_04445 [candidate division MSBL1 archaeon SCGC-AAA259B11]KXA99937.1 hypothetical protein AKJ40_02200 [candidate division MSBL1 archaeon SCGC-AAA259M10]
MLMFALLVILAFRFAFGDGDVKPNQISSIMWSTFLFTGLFALFNSFSREKDTQCLEGLLLCPGDRGGIYLGKMISTLIQIYVVELFGVAMMEIFFQFEFLTHVFPLLVILFIGSIALVSAGTIISAISVSADNRELVLPILFIPLVLLTVVVPVVSTTSGVLSGDPLSLYSDYLELLVGFSVIYIALALILFDEVIVR